MCSAARMGEPAATRPIRGMPVRSPAFEALLPAALFKRIPRAVPCSTSIMPFRSSVRRCSSAALGERNPSRAAISARVGGKPVFSIDIRMNARICACLAVNGSMQCPRGKCSEAGFLSSICLFPGGGSRARRRQPDGASVRLICRSRAPCLHGRAPYLQVGKRVMIPFSMAELFKVQYPILFSHCDPAGIVYFPRFFDLLHQSMEDWFTHGLKERFSDFIMKRKLGIPTVATRTEFVGPAKFGDTLSIELSILKMGRSSLTLAINSFVDERPCFRAEHTICLFSTESRRAVPVPEDLRERMERFVRTA